MIFDLSAILASKRAYRARLAALPIAEKLRMLDALRERAIALRRVEVTSNPPQAELDRLRGEEMNA